MLFKYILLGLVQGLAEFLPISSSGHLVLFQKLLNINASNNLALAVIVHFATFFSTIIVFRKDLLKIAKETLKFKWNDTNKYNAKLLLSAIPVCIVGLLFKDKIEAVFEGNLVFIGFMFFVTASILFATTLIKRNNNKITYKNSFLMGIAQALATLPGISRSGATIGTGLLLRTKKEETTRFSFYMVLLPILGVSLLELKDLTLNDLSGNALPLIFAFITALISGVIACKIMLKVVKNKKLYYFGIYCLVIGLITLFFLK